MNIKDRYKPYNFSKTKCFIIKLTVDADGKFKIEQKLPKQIKILRDIYITTSAKADELLIGTINLWFNEGIFKSFSLPVMNTKITRHNSRPLQLNEEMKPNSTMQGVYFHRSSILAFPFTVKIYLHYEEQL